MGAIQVATGEAWERGYSLSPLVHPVPVHPVPVHLASEYLTYWTLDVQLDEQCVKHCLPVVKIQTLFDYIMIR